MTSWQTNIQTRERRPISGICASLITALYIKGISRETDLQATNETSLIGVFSVTESIAITE